MLRMRTRTLILIPVAVAALGLMFWSCSKSSLTHQPAPSISFAMQLTSSELADLITSYRVIVTAPDMDTIMAPLRLEQGRFLVGEVDVPMGLRRTFIVQALDEAGTVVYEGVVVTDVPLPSETLTVPMQPAVSMVRLSPRRTEQVPPFVKLTVDVRAGSIDSLYGVSMRVRFDGYVVGPDSAYLNPSLDPGIIFFDTVGFDDAGRYHAIALTQTDQVTPIVDEHGNGLLARLVVETFFTEVDVESTLLSIEVTALSRIINSTPVDVPVNDVYTDGGTIAVWSAGTTDSIVRFFDPRLDVLIRGLINKPDGDIYVADVRPIDTLFAAEAGIENLFGLSHLANLEFLLLDYNNIGNLNELSVLTTLQALFLEGNLITDISALANLTTLRQLSLSYNQISDIGPLLENALSGGIGTNDLVFLIDNPIADTAQVDSLCLSGAAIFLAPEFDYCQPFFSESE